MLTPAFVTLTLNPAIDRSGTVHGLKPAEKLRCGNERTDPGGGGINVARVLTRLGAETMAVFPVAGPTGALLSKLVEAEHVRFHTVSVPGATRENFNVRDTASGEQYRFIFPGDGLASPDIKQCCDLALRHAQQGSYLVISGSLPPGAAATTYGALAKEACARGVKVVLDCSGKSLLRALGPELEIVKVSETELQEIAGSPLYDRERCAAAARHLLESGVRMVAVTRGSQGALLVTADESWEATAPSVYALSTVGAGDSFTAALLWNLAAHHPPGQALRAAVAAGSAALMSEGTGLATPANIKRLLESVQLRAVAHPKAYA